MHVLLSSCEVKANCQALDTDGCIDTHTAYRVQSNTPVKDKCHIFNNDVRLAKLTSDARDGSRVMKRMSGVMTCWK